MDGKRSRGFTLIEMLAGLILTLTGCGVDVEIPEKPPTTTRIKGWSDRRIASIETAVRSKDWKLPSRVKGLIRHLRGLEVNVAIGPGQKFKNTQEAIDALNVVILKLEGWHNQSLSRREGDSDSDRAALQTILDEAREILKNVQVNPLKAG